MHHPGFPKEFHYFRRTLTEMDWGSTGSATLEILGTLPAPLGCAKCGRGPLARTKRNVENCETCPGLIVRERYGRTLQRLDTTQSLPKSSSARIGWVGQKIKPLLLKGSYGSTPKFKS